METRHETGQQAFSPEMIALDADGRVDQDLICVECGYNLRALAAAGQCPECGLPVGETMRSHLAFCNGCWLRQLATGSRLAFHGALSLTVLPFAATMFAWVGTLVWPYQYVAWLDWAMPLVATFLAGLTLIGLWQVTAPEPASVVAALQGPQSNRLARPAVVVTGLLWYFAFTVPSGQWPWLHFLAIFISLVMWTTTTSLLSKLARRLPSRGLSRQLAILARLTAWVTAGTGVLCALVLVGIVAMETGHRAGGICEALLQAVGIIAAGGAVLWFALNIWYLVVLARFAGRMRTTATGAVEILPTRPIYQDWLRQGRQRWAEEIKHGLWWVAVGIGGSVGAWLVTRGFFWLHHYSWPVYGAYITNQTVLSALRALGILGELVAIAGALRATGRQWPSGTAARVVRWTRVTARVGLSAYGVLVVLLHAARFQSPSYETAWFLDTMVFVAGFFGWATFVAYLRYLGLDAQGEPSRQQMRTMTYVVAIAGLPWLCTGLWPVMVRLLYLPMVGDWQGWRFRGYAYAANEPLASVLWLVWELCLIVAMVMMYREWSRREA